jgi:hypothetical protein
MNKSLINNQIKWLKLLESTRRNLPGLSEKWFGIRCIMRVGANDDPATLRAPAAFAVARIECPRQRAQIARKPRHGPHMVSCAASPNAVLWRRCSFSSALGPSSGCEFRRIPARHTDLMPATVPK